MCVVFVLAILSNSLSDKRFDHDVCVVFVLAILSNSAVVRLSTPLVCVVFVLAILSNRNLLDADFIRCVLYLF